VLRAIYDARPACQGERTLLTFKGRSVPIVWRCSLPKHEDGYRRLHFYAFDVTEQKEHSDRLDALRAEAARAARVSLFGEMSASILHEVSQPLSAVGSSAEAALRWLARDEPDIGEATAAIARAARWARDATEICRKIRGFIAKAPVQFVEFAASDAVHAALFWSRPKPAQRTSASNVRSIRTRAYSPIGADPAGARESAAQWHPGDRYRFVARARCSACRSLRMRKKSCSTFAIPAPASNRQRSTSFSAVLHEQVRRHRIGLTVARSIVDAPRQDMGTRRTGRGLPLLVRATGAPSG
jgi:hypothetical protein